MATSVMVSMLLAKAVSKVVEVGNMAIPIFRASVSNHSHLCFRAFEPSFLPAINECSRKRSLLFCAPPELDYSVRPALTFNVGTHLIPHPSKVDRGGEDAFFASSLSGVISVADGVSGWAEQNVDPSLFPKELMINVRNLIAEKEVNNDPQILIGKAHAATSSVGSATAILAILEGNGILKIANVGDCGLRIIREGRVIFSTSPQEHYFDCPYQLSSETNGQTYLDAMVSSVEVVEGDTIVMGSDGLFDNIFDSEIVSTTAKHKDAVEAAKALADLARAHSVDSNFDSPYSMEARSKGFEVPWWKKALGMKLIGGKIDDITVIVGKVISS